MSEQTQAILTQYGQAGVAMLQRLVPKATGKTANSIEYIVIPNRLRIVGREFFKTLETGRGPRKSSKEGGFKDHILEWMNARGIGADLNEKKRKQLARFFAWKINKEGDATFKAGGRSIYSQQVDAFVDELSKAIANQKHKEYTDELMKQLGTLSKSTI